MNNIFNNRNLIIFLVLLNLGSLGMLWWGRQAPQERLERPDQQEIVQRELGLNPEQAKAFHAAQQSFFQESKPLISKIRDNRYQMFSQASSGGSSFDVAMGISEENCQIQSELDNLLIAHFAQLLEICGPEQEEKLQRIFKHSYGMQHRFKGGRGEKERPGHSRGINQRFH